MPYKPKPIGQMNKAELESHLRWLEIQLSHERKTLFAGLAKGQAATKMGALAGLATFAMAFVAFLVAGKSFLSGTELVMLVGIIVVALLVYMSFVYGRTMKLRLEVSATKGALVDLAVQDQSARRP